MSIFLEDIELNCNICIFLSNSNNILQIRARYVHSFIDRNNVQDVHDLVKSTVIEELTFFQSWEKA